MKQRIMTGVMLIFIVAVIMFFAQTPVLPFVIALGSVIAVFEIMRCIGMKKAYPFAIPLYALAASLPFLSRFMALGSLNATVEPESAKHLAQYGAILMISILFYFFTIAIFSRGKYNLADVCVLFATTFYILTGFNSIVIMHDNEQGGHIVFLAIFISAWVTDAGAYFCGMLFGRGGKHKLIPDVSPKKTIEGSIGGTIVCVLFMIAFGWVCNRFWGFDSNLLIFALVGFVSAIVAQIGDLLMSYVKRYYGIKDFGHLFPGHGGVLDRFDSIFSVAIAMMCLTTFLDFF
jgi:phosphatidate cytidylyltransferase